jgi:hypothetical protein
MYLVFTRAISGYEALPRQPIPKRSAFRGREIGIDFYFTGVGGSQIHSEHSRKNKSTANSKRKPAPTSVNAWAGFVLAFI